MTTTKVLHLDTPEDARKIDGWSAIYVVFGNICAACATDRDSAERTADMWIGHGVPSVVLFNGKAL